MAKNKTTETQGNIDEFLLKITDELRRKDFISLINLLKVQTGFEPKIWGTGIVGFGSYHYIYDSGHEGDAPLVAVASRSNAIALYLSANFENRDELLAQFGKHKVAKACIYINRLGDINSDILSVMVKNHMKHINELYPR